MAARRHRGRARVRHARSGSHPRQPRRARRQPVLRAARAPGARPGIRRRGGRARRERGAVGAGPRHRASRPRACRVRRAGGRLATIGGPHRRPVLRLAVRPAAHRRHHRHQRQDHLRVPRGAMPRAPQTPRGLHGHHRLGPHRRARESDPHHTGRRQRASHARAAQSAGRARGRDGGVLACARSGPHRRRAVAHGRIHQFEPRPSGLPPLDAGLRRGQGAPVHGRQICSMSSSTSATRSAVNSRRPTRDARR